jgi:7-cyano-7-deazaguanine synthase in queuosine biosynthesis
MMQLTLNQLQDNRDKYHVVCFSGGMGSALVAIEVARRYGIERLILLNHNIGSRTEDDDIQVYKEDVVVVQSSDS